MLTNFNLDLFIRFLFCQQFSFFVLFKNITSIPLILDILFTLTQGGKFSFIIFMFFLVKSSCCYAVFFTILAAIYMCWAKIISFIIIEIKFELILNGGYNSSMNRFALDNIIYAKICMSFRLLFWLIEFIWLIYQISWRIIWFISLSLSDNPFQWINLWTQFSFISLNLTYVNYILILFFYILTCFLLHKFFI